MIEIFDKPKKILRNLNADSFSNNNVKFQTNKFNDIDLIKYEVDKFKKSTKKYWMDIGESYYQNENEINDRVAYRYVSNGENEDSYKIVDNEAKIKKISNAFMKLIIDTKVGYILSKPPTVKADDKNYSALLNKIFNYKNHKAFKDAGTDALNKGIGWIHPAIEDNKLVFKVIPSEEIVPLWTDGEHSKLNGVIRFYEIIEIYKNPSGDYEEKQVPKYEYWDINKVQYYTEDDKGNIILDSEKYLSNHGMEYYHIIKNEDDMNGNINILGKGWGRVPFIAFKKDPKETPEVKFIKELIDDYDEKVSDNSTHVQELPDSIYTLTGVGGTDPIKLKENLKKFGLVILDDESASVGSINRNIIVDAFKVHIDILEKNIYLFSRSVNKNDDKFGNSPSGISLKFLYQDMDNDCNNIELEFKAAFDNLKYFIDTWLKQTGQGDFFEIEADIIFNRTLLVNEAELITNLKNSVGMISNETIMHNHPYVDDVAKEEERLDKENKKAQEQFDSYKESNFSGFGQENQKEDIDNADNAAENSKSLNPINGKN